MSHNTPVSIDPAIDQPLMMRKGRDGSILFKFFSEDGSAYPITDNFRFIIKASENAKKNIVDLTDAGDSITITDNEILVELTDDETNIDRQLCFYELINTSSNQSWFASTVKIIKGESATRVTSEIQATISLGEQVVSVTVTLPNTTVTVDKVLAVFQEMTTDEKVEFASLIYAQIADLIANPVIP